MTFLAHGWLLVPASAIAAMHPGCTLGSAQPGGTGVTYLARPPAGAGQRRSRYKRRSRRPMLPASPGLTLEEPA